MKEKIREFIEGLEAKYAITGREGFKDELATQILEEMEKGMLNEEEIEKIIDEKRIEWHKLNTLRKGRCNEYVAHALCTAQNERTER